MSALDKKSVKVQQVGTTLVAAFDNASPPLIWKFDLERNHSFALALQGGDGAWELGVTSGRNEFHPVARFRTQEDAEEAFVKTQNALLAKKKGNGWRTAALALIAVVVLLVAVIILPMISLLHTIQGKAQAMKAPAATTGEMKDGVPMDADQVLKPPP